MKNKALAPLLIENTNGQPKNTIVAVDRNTNDKENSNSRKLSQIPPVLKQTFVVTGAMLQKVSCGAAAGYSAILLPILMSPNSIIPTSDEEASWIMALFPIGNVCATFISPFLMRKYGRKSSINMSCLMILVAWTLCGTAQTITAILVGRFFHGLANGLQLVALSAFVTELTSPVYRGFFLGTICLSLSLGKFFSHIIGTFCDWRMTAFICSSLSLVSIIIMFLSPESPNFYAGKNQFSAAKRSFIWLRGTSQKSQEEMDIFIRYKMQKNSTFVDADNRNFFTTAIEVLKKKEVYKSLFVINMIFIIYVSSMNDFLAMFIINALKSLSVNENSSYFIMNTVDITRIISSLTGMLVIKKFNRRSVFFTSGALTFISLLSFSLLSFLIAKSFISSSPLLIGVVINILVFFISAGTLPLAYVYAGELFPLAHKEFGGFATSLFSGVYFIIYLKTSIFIMNAIHTHGLFLLYAVVHLLSLIVLYFILPETKGTTLVELEKRMVE